MVLFDSSLFVLAVNSALELHSFCELLQPIFFPVLSAYVPLVLTCGFFPLPDTLCLLYSPFMKVIYSCHSGAGPECTD